MKLNTKSQHLTQAFVSLALCMILTVTHGGTNTSVFSFSTQVANTSAAADTFADVICIGSR